MPGKKSYFRIIVLLLLVSLVFYGCTEEKPVQPALIPTPQNLTWNGEVFDMADSSSRFVKRLVNELPGVPFNQGEAYKLTVTNDSLVLVAVIEEGLFRGMQTIRQLTYSKKDKRLIPSHRFG